MKDESDSDNDSFDHGNHNNDGFAEMENEVYDDDEQGKNVDPEEEKKAAEERRK